MKPLIIEAAINGGTKKERNPSTPITPDETAAEALDALAAGASIIHNHIENIRLWGQPAADRYLEAYRKVIAARPDAILCPTACLAPTRAEKLQHIQIMAETGLIRMGTLDPGVLNFANSGENGLPGPKRAQFTITFDEIELVIDTLAASRLGPSIAAYEPGFLHTTLAYYRAGRLPPGSLTKLYFSGEYNFDDFVKGGFKYFGLLPGAKGLDAYLEIIGDSGLPWCVAVPGGDVTASGLTKLAIEKGGHVRVGLEDYAGPKTPRNRELIEEVIAIAKQVGRPVATPRQAAEILRMPR